MKKHGNVGKIPWNKGKHWSPAVKNKISTATKGRVAHNKGIPQTDETKRKISKANKGKTWKLSNVSKRRIGMAKLGSNNPMWKGNLVGYKAVHEWINRHHGQPKKCSKCESVTERKYEWANISGRYERDIKDYIRLCVKCHQIFDNRMGGVKNGND